MIYLILYTAVCALVLAAVEDARDSLFKNHKVAYKVAFIVIVCVMALLHGIIRAKLGIPERPADLIAGVVIIVILIGVAIVYHIKNHKNKQNDD